MLLTILRWIIDLAIPVISAYLASDDSIVVWLIQNDFLSADFNIDMFQRVCLIINIFFTSFVIYLRLQYHISKEEQYHKEIAGLYNVIKQFAQSNFATISKNKNFNFNLRIFVPEFCFLNWIRALWNSQLKGKWFVIRNIEPFAKKDITEHLRFRVDPNEQGLVGSAYKTKAIVYDDHLSLTNSTDYSLEHTQLQRTSNLRWSICVPIINNRNEVIAVMAFDSDSSELNIEKNRNEIQTMTNTLAIMMKDSVPELFKKKRSLW